MSEVIFTSESVTRGHPDKLCDQISDAAIDAFLAADADAYAAVECAVATGVVFLAARFACESAVDLPGIARAVIADAGYVGRSFDARKCSILTSFTELPASARMPLPEPGDAEALDRYAAQDQANVFGFACRDTPEMMPLPISLAHRLARALDGARADLPMLSPDAKTQVAVVYDHGRPKRIHSVSVTALDEGDTDRLRFEATLRERAKEALRDGGHGAGDAFEIHVNATDQYELGGPQRHAGLTGRKSGIDGYGEYARQSGSAMSGKDPARIARAGAYAARHAAKNIVAAGLADRCEVHLAYEIGVARPISLSLETFGTAAIEQERITRRLGELVDFRPGAIARRFDLRSRPGRAGADGFYRRLAAYGHFGRPDLDLPWEALDLVEMLRD
jgi:S-adenosylmethionine synthetase